MDAVVLSFPRPERLMSMNDRYHWHVRARLVKAWREGAAWATAAAKVGRLPRCEVIVTLPVRDKRRRDPHNYYPTVKAIVDGLVDAGVWGDDTPEWVVTTEPRLRVASDRLVTVHLIPTPLEAA